MQSLLANTGRMDSGPARRGASRNDEVGWGAPHMTIMLKCRTYTPQMAVYIGSFLHDSGVTEAVSLDIDAILR